MENKKCTNCKDNITENAYRGFCSRFCFAESLQKPNKDKRCSTCKEELPKGRKKYCNATCWENLKRTHCKECGEELTGEWQINFCSRACSATHNNKGVRRNGKKPPDCEVCGEPCPSGKARTCGQTCYTELIRKEGREKRVARFLAGDATLAFGEIKRAMIELGVKTRNCDSCGSSQWLGKKLVLELHHIDANHNNIAKENLELLCPNCHSITDNWRGRNIGKKIPVKK